MALSTTAAAARAAWRDKAPDGELRLGEHHVYLVFGRNGRLLYVGVTGNLPARLAQHAATSPWYHRADVVRWEAFTDRFAAERREADLIAELEPEFNVLQPWPVPPR